MTPTPTNQGIKMATYSGDNYPGHPHHAPAEPASPSPLQRSVNDLAFVLNAQEDLLNKLASKISPVLGAMSPLGGGEKVPAEVESKCRVRADIDGQAARIRATNATLEALIDAIET